MDTRSVAILTELGIAGGSDYRYQDVALPLDEIQEVEYTPRNPVSSYLKEPSGSWKCRPEWKDSHNFVHSVLQVLSPV